MGGLWTEGFEYIWLVAKLIEWGMWCGNLDLFLVDDMYDMLGVGYEEMIAGYSSTILEKSGNFMYKLAMFTLVM